jgi:hypothetical protein
MSEFIITSGTELTSVTAIAEAIAIRDELLSKARKGTVVTDAQSNQRAAEILKSIKAFTRSVEDSRKAAKAPILELSRQVDALSAQLVLDLETEATRISRLVGSYQQEQERIAAAERQRAYEEEQRLRREAEQKQRDADERARKEQEELAAKAARARTEAGRERAEKEAEEARQRAAQEAHDRAVKVETAAVQTRIAVPVITKPTGISSRSDVKFEITDIVKLYEANAAFVILTPNNAALKAALKQLPEGQTLPGVRHWREAAAIVR